MRKLGARGWQERQGVGDDCKNVCGLMTRLGAAARLVAVLAQVKVGAGLALVAVADDGRVAAIAFHAPVRVLGSGACCCGSDGSALDWLLARGSPRISPNRRGMNSSNSCCISWSGSASLALGCCLVDRFLGLAGRLVNANLDWNIPAARR